VVLWTHFWQAKRSTALKYRLQSLRCNNTVEKLTKDFSTLETQCNTLSTVCLRQLSAASRTFYTTMTLNFDLWPSNQKLSSLSYMHHCCKFGETLSSTSLVIVFTNLKVHFPGHFIPSCPWTLNFWLHKFSRVHLGPKMHQWHKFGENPSTTFKILGHFIFPQHQSFKHKLYTKQLV